MVEAMLANHSMRRPGRRSRTLSTSKCSAVFGKLRLVESLLFLHGRDHFLRSLRHEFLIAELAVQIGDLIFELPVLLFEARAVHWNVQLQPVGWLSPFPDRQSHIRQPLNGAAVRVCAWQHATVREKFAI